jgi:hypothetical protein
MTIEERSRAEELLEIQKRRLHALKKQQASFGIYAPPHITMEIDEIQAQIRVLEQDLGLRKQSSNAGEETKLSLEQTRYLVELLFDIPSMKHREGRDDVLKQLPDRITNAISRRNDVRADVMNIVLTTLNYEDGLEHLVEAVRFFDEGTWQMQALDDFLKRAYPARYKTR